MNRITGIFIAILFATALHAQDTLSLARAISIGLKNNFDVQIEQLNVEVAENNNTWGQAGRFPTISFSGNQNNNMVQRKPANPFAVPGRNKSNNLNGQLDVQFVLFDGFAVKINKQRLAQLEQLSYGNAAFVMETTLQSIMLAYYQALLEKERLHILENNMTFSKERYDYVKLRKELGGAISFDVLQEQNNYLTDSANVLLQGIVYKNSLRQLNLLLNEDLQKGYTLVDSLGYRHETYDYETLKAKMVSSNTNLRNQYLNQEILRSNTKLQQANMSPTVALNFGGNGSLDQLNANFRTTTGNTIVNTVGYLNGDPSMPVTNTVNETAFVPQTQNGNSYGGYANLSLRFTLFNGGQIRRAIENSRAQEKIAELNTGQLKLSLENDLLANYDMYNLRNQLVAIAQTKLEAADLNLDLANERYRNGALSAIDLRIVQENARNAALEAYQAIFNSISSKIGLIRITGGLIDKAGE
ncbi:MAG: TolC family protein [Cyclobacteriaceae bacterium]|nr:TolC family protein [Cyclobacteriaceae bacterium]MCB9237623.1 TolC family protein [Flammeovirgaceae bacterium]MCB0498863.1 TolC family protein [Cyclobacteriaceae bacterium]MCO5270275.1 TolC family protein [Cyclobacteriaceae bacterium]MCW5902251.1 TolC family protein [Cyclobacteriaceae bacterium]